jgi:hypothetical protein
VSRYATHSALALFTILFLLALLARLALVLLLLAGLLTTALLLLLTGLAVLLVRIILLVHLRPTPSVSVRVNAPPTGWLPGNSAWFLHAERFCAVQRKHLSHGTLVRCDPLPRGQRAFKPSVAVAAESSHC